MLLSAEGMNTKVTAFCNVVARTVKGKDDIIQLAVVALIAEGHLLIEDVPGVGKTTLGHAMARALSCNFHRIQFTSDLFPPTSSASPSSTRRPTTSNSRPARSSPTSCLPMKSTARRPKLRAHCWKP